MITSTAVLALDLVGTFAFAISGATLGVRKQLDLFGVLVLSFAAATAGGIARDALIGAVPPAALADWRYLAVSIFAGLITFYGYPSVERLTGVPGDADGGRGRVHLLCPAVPRDPPQLAIAGSRCASRSLIEGIEPSAPGFRTRG